MIIVLDDKIDERVVDFFKKHFPPLNGVSRSLFNMENKRGIWEELKTGNHKTLITMGLKSTSMMLREEHKSFKNILSVPHNVEYTATTIIPWYSLSYVLRKDQKLLQETINLITNNG